VTFQVTEEPLATPPLSEDERSAAFRRLEPKVPRNFVLIVLAVFAVLGLGGVLGERLVSSVGLNPASTNPTPSTVPRRVTPGTAVVAPPASPSPAQEVGATLPAFMGITTMAGTPAPLFTLVDQSGQAVSLADERGDAVVVTFFDSPCQDICSIMSAELRQADDDLGSEATHVVFLTVNTDPVALSAAPASAAAARTGLGALPNWHFLTSSLGRLNTVWKAYGVAVTVAPTSKLVAHNDVMYFIGPTGRLRYRATPFANENASGVFSLSPSDVARWGQGIATYTRRLLGNTP
jgi:protein SCO1/2